MECTTLGPPLKPRATTHIRMGVGGEGRPRVADGGGFTKKLRRYIGSHGVDDDSCTSRVALRKGRYVEHGAIHYHPASPVQDLSEREINTFKKKAKSAGGKHASVPSMDGYRRGGTYGEGRDLFAWYQIIYKIVDTFVANRSSGTQA